MGTHPNSNHRLEEAAAPAETPALLHTVENVARLLSVSRSKVYALIEGGRLPAHRLPAIRVSQDDLNGFLDGCRTTSRAPVPKTQTIKLKHLR